MISSLSISFSFPLLKPKTIRYGPPKTINTQKRSRMKTYLSDNKKPEKVNCVVRSPIRESSSERKDGHGIGITRFLQGKNYLITGSTGFVGKVLVEKMLRTAPDVGQIFVLIKAKDKEAASNRLKTEIIESELLKSLEKVYGINYRAYLMKKLVAVPGCVCESDLGMDPLTANEIAKKVNVIVNSAASTKFNDRYDVALNSNTKGPTHLLNFAKTCNNICLFLHISTAYVSDGEEKIIEESPLCMGESNVTRKRDILQNQESVPRLDINYEMKLATDLKELVNGDEAAQEMKILGLQRAKIHGWPNIYSFTKAMGEMLITGMKGDIPIAIVRPTVIGSTYKEPFSGWIEGNRMFDPFTLSYGKGKLTGKYADPNMILDMVPVDMVVNAAISVMAKHGSSCNNPDLAVYHFGSSMINPISFGDMVEYWYKHFKRCPLSDSKGNDIRISKMKFFESFDAFSSFISSEMEKKSGLMEPVSLEPNLYSKLQVQCNKRARHFIQMAKAYEPYTFYKARFDIGNTQKLMEEISNEEMREFWFDLGGINWEEYICNIHIPGLRKHVLKSNK